MSKTPDTARSVRCPGCGGESVYSTANAYRPFCSLRCQQIDFGAWASGDFRVPAEAAAPDEPQPDHRLPH